MTKIPSVKLGELGDLRSGYSPRKKLSTLPENATHWSIPLRAISKDLQQVDWSSLEPIEFEGDDARYLLKDRDVLISTRSIFVAIYVERVPKQVLINNNWVILSPFAELDGRYFAWWFNHPRTQQCLERFILGSAQVLFLPLAELKKLKVPLPTLTQQASIAILHQLRQREKELTQKLEEKRDRLFQALTFKFLKGDLQ